MRVSKKRQGDGNRYDPSSVSIISYEQNKNNPWSTSDGGQHSQGGYTATYRVTSVGQAQSSNDYRYESVYNVQVTLINGGIGWRVGDQVQVEMLGRKYDIKVEEEDFGYGYASEASVNYTTAASTEEGTLDVGSIVGGIVGEINALSNYVAQPIGNVIHVRRTDSRDFNLQTRGGTVNNALYGIKGRQ